MAAKKRLFDGLASAATAVVNADDPASDAMLADCSAAVVRFGMHSRAQVRADIHELSADGSRFTLILPQGRRDVVLPFVGRHNIANALASAAAAMALGVDVDTIVRGLQNAKPVPGRLERVPGPTGTPTVLVDYAHTDDALDNVLRAVRALRPGRLTVMFGCGGDRDKTKRPRMARVAMSQADQVVITSDNPRSESPHRIIDEILDAIPVAERQRVHVEADRQAAIDWSVRQAVTGEVVLLAGKGHETYQIIGTERIAFDDRVMAAESLKRHNLVGRKACV